MKKTFILPFLLGVSALFLQAQMSLPADTAHFTINQGNHPVGRSDFSILPVKQGSIATTAAYSVTSHGTLSIQNTKYSFSGSGSLDGDLSILQEDLNGIVNGSAVTFAVHPSGVNFVIDISADGRSYRNSLHRPGATVFFPDFDLAAYDILLNLATRHPGTPISALIPKQTGILSAATLAAQADVQGTLNGKALTLHHTSLTVGSVVSELYYASDNRILEVDIPGQTFAVVRDNFQLQPPPPPPADANSGNQPQPGTSAPPSQPQ
jgi:hypothetical protein